MILLEDKVILEDVQHILLDPGVSSESLSLGTSELAI